jgi:mycothiol synthase
MTRRRFSDDLYSHAGTLGRVPEIRAATLDDVGEVYALLDARSRATFGISELSRRYVEGDFRRADADRFVAVAAGVIVGYAHLTSAHELVHAASDAGVADALLERVEARARERGFDAIEVTVVAEDKPLDELVRRAAFSHERDVLRMWRGLDEDVPQPAWPEGVAVRTYEDADGPRVHALLDEAYGAWDATYVPLAHDAWLAFMTDHEEFDPALWFLVEREGTLAACALHWHVHQRRGWVKDIAVRESERGAGLGKALLHEGFRAYAARGAERVGLKVDATNPTGAIALYEQLGFVTDRRYGIWRKEL